MKQRNGTDPRSSADAQQVEPFTIDVADEVLRDLKSRLGASRFPDQISGSGWSRGIDLDYLRDLVEYWREGYDWRRQEAQLNRLAHFRTEIDGLRLHFAHVRSPHAHATPLILIHGWPGSFVEFLDVVGPLTEPERYGGDVNAACHVVLPSLPGYGFSERPRIAGWNQKRTARAYATLMARLGYERYVAQGGDWGAFVATEMALADPGHMLGLHLNMPVAPPPVEPVQLSARDQDDIKSMTGFLESEAAYALLQGTKPQTIGVALNDSPAGLCGWIAEKFHSWADYRGESANVIGRDRLLTNIMLYWVTGSAASAASYYYEFYNQSGAFDSQAFARAQQPVTVPTGVARFPKEIICMPRTWVERRYNVVRWTDMPRGGHFAALEQPKLFSDEVRSFVNDLRRP